MEKTALIADHLTKNYGKFTAIEDVSFSLNTGQIGLFLGPNGAGKSTTLRILTAIMPASSGKAFVCGQSVAHYPYAIHRYLGYLAENNPLPSDLRIEEYIRYRARLKGVPSKKVSAAVERALKACDIQPKHYKNLIGNLSKGYRQRVGIAEAIVHEPKVLILDEPTIGLDPHQVLGFRQLMHRLKGEMTILISSHLLAEMETLCDKAIIIYQGHILTTGTLDELTHRFIKQTNIHIEALGLQEDLEKVIANTWPDRVWKLQSSEKNSPNNFKLKIQGTVDSKEHAMLIKALATHTHCHLNGYQPEAHSLESIFLAATQRHW